MALSLSTFIIKALSIMTLSIRKLNTMKFNVEYRYAEFDRGGCCYAEKCYAEFYCAKCCHTECYMLIALMPGFPC
jgi:hypothetical protein